MIAADELLVDDRPAAAAAVSRRSAKSLPASSGIPIVAEIPGRHRVASAPGRAHASVRARPSRANERSGRPWMSSGTASRSPPLPHRARAQPLEQPRGESRDAAAVDVAARADRRRRAARLRAGSRDRCRASSRKLRKKSAAATSTASASATSTPISALRSGCGRALREPERSARCGSTRESCAAGASAEDQPARDAERDRQSEAARSTLVWKRIGKAPMIGTARSALGRPRSRSRRRAPRPSAPAAGSP